VSFRDPGAADHVGWHEITAAGDGMTVLDVASLDEAVRLATTDDQAVVSGVLVVEVRPWRVLMSRQS